MSAADLSSPVERLAARIMWYLASPARVVLAVLRRLPFGSHELRCALDLYPRPHYAYGVQQAAVLAQRLGLPAISVIEFGVAGGRGLIELERVARASAEATGVEVHVYGFDRATGLPEPDDYRDLPYTWGEGEFSMDVAALKARLTSAQLILGDIDETVVSFTEDDIAPVGFVSIDVDYYSSTVDALRLFEGKHDKFLPRVFCYLDDTVGDDDQTVHNDYVGELAAIREFNDAHSQMKMAPINGLRHKRVVPAAWNDAIQVLHRFDHPDYGRHLAKPAAATRLPL